MKCRAMFLIKCSYIHQDIKNIKNPSSFCSPSVHCHWQTSSNSSLKHVLISVSCCLPWNSVGSLHCSTDPTLSLHIEQGGILCSKKTPLAYSSHVTADYSPLCKKTVIEASIWYGSDVAFTTAFLQHRAPVLASTIKTQTTISKRPQMFSVLLCCTLSCNIKGK